MKAFLAEVVDIRYTGWQGGLASFISISTQNTLTAAHEDFVRPVLVPKLWRIAFPWFLYWSTCAQRRVRQFAHKFDRYLLIVQEVRAFKYHAEGTLANLLANAVMDAHHVRGRGRHICDLAH